MSTIQLMSKEYPGNNFSSADIAKEVGKAMERESLDLKQIPGDMINYEGKFRVSVVWIGDSSEEPKDSFP